MMSPVLSVVLLTVALSGGAIAFAPIGGDASTHVSITGTALLQKVRETCRAVAESSGHEFNPTGNSPEELVQACLGPKATGEVSAAKFRSALNEIYVQNGLVDRDFINSPPHHFNNEAFLEGRGLITEGVASIKANIRNQNFQAARETLGRVLHTLQDFYSHSNWVELGFTDPYVNLIRPDLPLENLAEKDAATCSDCGSGTCPNPILPIILQEKKLTSGYMGIFSEAKPKGKCSHGGAADLTSTVVPRGGINKDERRPDNVAFHKAAVNLATSASLQLLEDIRGAAGDNDFLRMVGIARASVVCFVIDTTGSMHDDIAEVRRLINQIVDSKKGTQDEPSEYILVPFNDPKFGPMTRTPDGDVMKATVSKLTASGGGDLPEMCLSGLQLALTGAPASSQIFVFTDATAKDIALKDTIVALIRSTKSTVSFFMTGSRRSRRSLKAGTFNDYKELALASGGQAIEVSKSQLPQATDIILDTSTSALVTVLQQDRKAGKETFPFVLDGSLTNATLYITGKAISFTLTNPEGVSQKQSEASGNLGTIQYVGNLWRIRLNADKLPGTWQISIITSHPYTLKVTGQSAITFIYNFVEAFDGPHPGYAVITGRPNAGQPATLLLSVMGKKGPDSVSIENVGLGMVSGAEAMSSGTTTDMGNGDILVTVDSVPEGEFVVMMNGTDSVSRTNFQRQSTTQMSVSKVTIKAAVDSSLEPGKTFSLPFSVMTLGSGGTYTIKATNDREFNMTLSPPSITLTPGQYANVTLTITPPGNTPSGTDVTLTIDAKSSSGADSNYAVLRLSVVSKITDFVSPLCNIVSVQAENCPEDVSQCEAFSWQLSANITDGNGTGIESITRRQGDGDLQYTSLDAPPIHATYNASCCSQIVELIVVDKGGNVGKCYHSIDSVSPVCNIVSVQAENCPEDVSQCEPFSWQLSANITDGNGTGIESITRRQGDGDLQYTSLDAPPIHATYNASCCSQIVELIVVDKGGNVGKCYHSIDSVSPVCNIVSVQAENCPEDVFQCEASSWELSANITDGKGTGIESITRRQGDGDLQYTSLDTPLIHATYNASCCSQIVELIAVDKGGNEGRCYHSIIRPDFVEPICKIVSVKAENCPEDESRCESFNWELSATLTDGIGTGIKRIKLHQGDGDLQYTSLDAPLINATYNASCCSQKVEMIAVDEVGNLGRCYHSIYSSGPPALTLSLPLWLCLLVSAFVPRH